MQLVIDFDGTIANSAPLLLKKLKDALPYPIELETLRSMSFREILDTMHIGRLHFLYLIYSIRKEFQRNIHDIGLVEHMEEALKKLNSQGHQLHIVSSNSARNIRQFLKHHHISHYFESVSSLYTVFNKATGLKGLIRTKKMQPSEVIYIGDETRDIEAAAAAGIKSCAVSWGLNNAEALMRYKPDFVLNHPGELSLLFAEKK
ncbi:HAD-superfamily hydrolase [Legionella birminghamensis]|uniref:HAD-superfamily hydrolase n=1 Tax=Legionella birminghamensis TaxID=28083 RepID=A0A378ID78_9GAMM|nr:HAD-IA family hydrolase [Legionella birminghamensis]KTC68860.1 HAD-superfamily hydrolase [Legionella birminghamensis]STX33198.1 HAD-superfamily hydrolase [Legionella birminghamensis]